MKKVMGTEVKAATKGQIDKVLNGELSKSKKMIALFEMGLEVKEIQQLMEQHQGSPMRYNFVYNVVSNYCNMNQIPVEKKEAQGKKEEIIRLFLEGKSNKEISIELKTNYNYVHSVLKTFKAAIAGETEAAGE